MMPIQYFVVQTLVQRVKRMKEQLSKYHNIGINYVMLDKTRKEANVIDEMIIIGDVLVKIL
jgi:uncharacterized coiled-coil DUF342 family protein